MVTVFGSNRFFLLFSFLTFHSLVWTVQVLASVLINFQPPEKDEPPSAMVIFPHSLEVALEGGELMGGMGGGVGEVRLG